MWNRIRHSWRRRVVPLYRGKGTLAGEYIGRSHEIGDWWLAMLCGKKCPPRLKGVKLSSSAWSYTPRPGLGIDMLIYQAPPVVTDSPPRANVLRVPYWAEHILPLADADLSKSKSLADARRRARKNGFEYQITCAESDFSDFYDNLYVPFARMRKAVGTVVFPRDVLARVLAENGRLLAVKQGEKTVAAGLIDMRGKTPLFHSSGVLVTPEADYFRLGALAVLFYLLGVYLQQEGCAEMSLGGSRPLISDGSLRFKSEIGGILVPSRSMGTGQVAIRVLRDTPEVKRFLENNPMVLAGPDHRWAVFGNSDRPNFSLEGLVAKWQVAGLGSPVVYDMGNACCDGAVPFASLVSRD